MKGFDQMEEALMRNQFRAMYHDIGMEESLEVLFEIVQTANILLEVLGEERSREDEENRT